MSVHFVHAPGLDVCVLHSETAGGVLLCFRLANGASFNMPALSPMRARQLAKALVRTADDAEAAVQLGEAA